MNLKLKNIGIVKSADIKIDGLAVLADEFFSNKFKQNLQKELQC